MGILTGAMTARRFRVVGDLPSGWRDVFRERLDSMAFREPVSRTGKEEVEGWVQVHNLLDTNFSNFNDWLSGPYAVFSLRVDKKTLPANLFRATVEKRCREWCEQRGSERCPAAVKKEIQERLELEWLERTLPRVSVTEICWNTNEGWVLVGALSDKVGDRVRKRFHRTFGLELHAWSPLDWLDDASTVEKLLATGPSSMGGEG
jgi:DNA recombination-dependent growth factor C